MDSLYDALLQLAREDPAVWVDPRCAPMLAPVAFPPWNAERAAAAAAAMAQPRCPYTTVLMAYDMAATSAEGGVRGADGTGEGRRKTSFNWRALLTAKRSLHVGGGIPSPSSTASEASEGSLFFAQTGKSSHTRIHGYYRECGPPWLYAPHPSRLGPMWSGRASSHSRVCLVVLWATGGLSARAAVRCLHVHRGCFYHITNVRPHAWFRVCAFVC